MKAREAWWQLTEEQRQSVVDEIRKSRAGVAVRRLASFAVGQNRIFVNVWPDMESYHENEIAISPQGLNLERYWNMDVTLGSAELPHTYGIDTYASQDDLPLV